MARKKRQIDPELIKELSKRMKVTPRTVNNRIQKVKKDYKMPLMSDETAVSLLASEKGISDIELKGKFGIPPEDVYKAFEIQSKRAGVTPITQHETTMASLKSPTALREKAPSPIRISPDPILSEDKLEEAKKMAREVYPLFYVLENSIRELVIRIMENAYPGKDWWNEPNVIPNSEDNRIKSNVERIMKDEEEKPWPGQKEPGTNPIYYTYLWHLREIIIHDNNWKLFKPILKRRRYVELTIDEVMTCRNNIMHCNPLQTDDIKVVRHRLEQWQKRIRRAKSQGLVPDRNL